MWRWCGKPLVFSPRSMTAGSPRRDGIGGALILSLAPAIDRGSRREKIMTPHELKDRVAQIIAEEVGPALDLDGTAIEVVGVEGGVVQVRLGGACAGCPSSIMTLVMGLEQELRKRIPEAEYIEAVP